MNKKRTLLYQLLSFFSFVFKRTFTVNEIFVLFKKNCIDLLSQLFLCICAHTSNIHVNVLFIFLCTRGLSSAKISKFAKEAEKSENPEKILVCHYFLFIYSFQTILHSLGSATVMMISYNLDMY